MDRSDQLENIPFPSFPDNQEEANRELSLLMQSMINAFVLFQSVFDDKGVFVSYRFLYINRAYEEITGVLNDEVKGRTVHEVWPGTEDHWVRLYGHTAVTGESQTFEQYHDPTGKYYLCKTYRPWDSTDRFCVIFEDITEERQQKEQLQKMRWLLESESVEQELSKEYPLPYGDITELNENGLIKSAVPPELLKSLASEIMLLLGSSLAVYEKNGDYAFGIFSSGWCRTLDSASRGLCNTDDNAEALASGRWLCHECCWNRSAVPAIQSGKPADIQCCGHIRMYSVPIKAGSEIVGAMNIGYGTPPSDAETLQRLSEAFGVDADVLERSALEYKPRPPFIVEVAKLRLRNTAMLIGEAVERYRTRRELGTYQKNYRNLFSSMKDGVVVYAPVDGGKDFTFFDANPSAEKLSKFNKEEVLGRRVTEVFPSVEEIGLLDVFRKVCKDGITRKLPITLYKDQRFEQWVENTVYRMDSGHVVAVYIDKSDEQNAKQALERKTAELEEMNVNLEQRVNRRTRQLETANKELEDFAYSVSHDLRAPLRAIDGFSRLIVSDYSSVLDEEGLRLLNVVRTNTSKMNDLITDILDLSRVGRRELKLSRLDMKGMVESVFHEIASPEELEEFQLVVDDIPDVNADPTLIKQVWVNLISNALKYSSASRKKLITITGKKEGGKCIYSIKDSGVGFNPRYSDKLFKLFQRLHGNSEFSGSGVGLAIVQKVINRHGGEVSGEGEEGGGAVFHFSLPDRRMHDGY